jgi:MATE family multidrug resistance protein
MFLTWYAPEAIAAAMPAGLFNFTIMCLFIGTASYVNTFVAQYYGAKQYIRIGPALWQGIYVSLVGGFVLLLFIPLAQPIFRFVGHEPLIQKNEIIYFQTLCLGAAPAIASTALSCFYIGRGKTWPVMGVNIFSTAVNLVMDYALIFGKLGFHELGMKGAAIATVISGCLSFLIYFVLIARKTYNDRFHTLRGWRLENLLFRRLMRFGLPSGIQFFLDIAGFTVFVLLMGRLGTIPLAATNIAFNINTVAFMPMIGAGMAVSVLVGQNLGENQPETAERSVFSGLHLTCLYIGSIAFLYVFVPGLFLGPFSVNADPLSFQSIRDITIILLRFVAVYSLFDTMNIIFSSALKGAGDTRFIMYSIIILSFSVLVIPSYFAIVIFHAGVYTGWAIASAYIILLGLLFLFRFLGGKWKTMRVIEEAPPLITRKFPETPLT